MFFYMITIFKVYYVFMCLPLLFPRERLGGKSVDFLGTLTCLDLSLNLQRRLVKILQRSELTEYTFH